MFSITLQIISNYLHPSFAAQIGWFVTFVDLSVFQHNNMTAS